VTNSRAKGARGEREFIAQHLVSWWPEAGRNLDQYDEDKRDVVTVAGIHWQIKRKERLNIWEALAQAHGEAIGGAVPVVAFRRNHSAWYCAAAAADFVPMFAVALRATG
jgi:hypothetical protein